MKTEWFVRAAEVAAIVLAAIVGMVVGLSAAILVNGGIA